MGFTKYTFLRKRKGISKDKDHVISSLDGEFKLYTSNVSVSHTLCPVFKFNYLPVQAFTLDMSVVCGVSCGVNSVFSPTLRTEIVIGRPYRRETESRRRS